MFVAKRKLVLGSVAEGVFIPIRVMGVVNEDDGDEA